MSAPALISAAEAENAAIFTYGVTTAYVSATRRPTILENVAAHRAARDALDDAIRAAGEDPPPAAAGYELPIDVTDPTTAADVALAAEIDCGRAYRALLEQAEDRDHRRLGVDGLTACALRAAGWRVALEQSPVTEAFPGA